MSIFLPLPPNPDESQYANPLAYKRALYDWALQTKGRLEQSQVLQNGVPVAAPAIGQIPIKGTNAWLAGYIGTGLAAGAGISITGTATSTIANNLSAGGGISITGTATSTIAVNGAQIPGSTTNDSASAGNIGQYISSSVATGTSAVNLSSGTAANITNIALTPGDWDVWVNSGFTGGTAATAAYLKTCLSTSSAALDTSNGRYAQQNPANATIFAAGDYYLNAGPTRLSLTGTSTAYLVSAASFGVSTCAGFGTIQARRRR